MDVIEIEASTLGQLWEDEETKSFYENLVDLKAFIPAILYKDSSQQGALQEDKLDEEGNDDDDDAEEEVELEEGFVSAVVDDANEEEIAPVDMEGEFGKPVTLRNLPS